MSFIDSASPSGGVVNVRAPRAWIGINGAQIPCLSASVTRKSEKGADTFSADFSATQSAQLGLPLAFWADYQPTDVQIIMATALDGSDATSMVTGQIDVPHIRWADMTITVSGRDKGAPMTEQRRSQKFTNQRSSDVVNTVAQSYGLGVSIVSTSDFAGKIYDQDTDHLVLNFSDHEILNDLAEREGYRWYVDGSTLYFEPRETQSGVYTLFWAPPGVEAPYGVASFTDLETHRNMTAARPHSVTVKSFHHRDKKLYTATNQASGVGDTVEVEHHHNGRNQDQSDRLSKSRLKDAIRHDCNVVAKAPGDLSVDVRQKLQLTGTGTIYDQLYDIDSISFDYHEDDGLDMTISAKVAKSGRSGTDDTGAKGSPATADTTSAPLPPERPAGIGTNSNATPLTTPANSGGIGSA